SKDSKSLDIPKNDPIIFIKGCNEDSILFPISSKEITVENITEKTLLFKVLLTYSAYYQITPSTGCILPRESVNINIELKKDIPHVSAKMNNKFQIQALIAQPDMDEYSDENWKESYLVSELKSMILQVVYTYNNNSENNALSEKIETLQKWNEELKSELDNFDIEKERLLSKIEAYKDKLDAINDKPDQEGSSQNKPSLQISEISIVKIIQAAFDSDNEAESKLGKQLLLAMVGSLVVGYFIGK
ncbi:MAG: phosphatidylinositol-binding protein scs2, partial [Paramarteilia canceri]